MRRVILLASIVNAHAKELVLKLPVDIVDSVDELVDKLADKFLDRVANKFFDRMLNMSPTDRIDNTTLAQIHGRQLVFPRSSFSTVRSQFSVLHSSPHVPQMPCLVPLAERTTYARASTSTDAANARKWIANWRKSQSLPSATWETATESLAPAPAPAPSLGEVAAVGKVADESEAMASERTELKSALFNLCASYDRGFAATPRAQKAVDEVLLKLEAVNPMPVNASRGIQGQPHSIDDGSPPLEGIWRMVWTTAQEVLNLGASPVAIPGAIHQVIDPSGATNYFDFIPRPQQFFGTSAASTLLRAEIKSRSSPEAKKLKNRSNRVALTFESVKLVPVEVLGQKADLRELGDRANEYRLRTVGAGVVPQLAFDNPEINLKDLPGVDPEKSPRYYDVRYLDDEMLILKQVTIGRRLRRPRRPRAQRSSQQPRFQLPRLPPEIAELAKSFQPPRPPKREKIGANRVGNLMVFVKVPDCKP